MAAEPLSTTRRALLGAAASLPVVAIAGVPAPPVIASGARQSSSAAEIWTRRLARYRRLHARMNSEPELEILRAAYLRHARDVEAIQARFGNLDAAEATEEGRLLCDAVFEQREAAENAYHDRCVAPTDRAAVLLALTPAPDFEALLVKIRLMQEHRLDELDGLERPALELLADDVGWLIADEKVQGGY